MQDSRMAFENAFRRALVLLALAAGVALSGCNTGSMTDGLASTAAMNQQVPPPPSASASAKETALAAQTATSSAPDAAIAQQTATGGTAPAQPQGATKSASLGGSVPPVAFLPVTGAPQSAVTNLASSMRMAAKSEAVPVVVSIEQGARYQVKGYFSALSDGNGTILVYVWDVLDANGTRVHRISGQERAGATGGDPWAAITPDILNRVAGITMEGLKTWITTRGAG
jgi:hypothetical protein